MQEADGSVIIDSEIRTEGAEGDISQLRDALRELTVAVKELSRNMTDSFTGAKKSVVEMADEVSDATKKAKKNVDELSKTTVKTDEYGKLERELSDLEAQFESVEQKEREMRSLGFSIDSEPYQDLEHQLDRIYDQMEAVRKKQEALLSRQMESITITGLDPVESPVDDGDYDIFGNRVDMAAAKARELEAVVHETSESEAQDFDKVTGKAGGIQNAIDMVKRTISDIPYIAHYAFSALSSHMDGAKTKTMSLQDEIDRYTDALYYAEQKGLGLGDKQYDEAYRGLALAKKKAEEYKKSLVGVDTAQKKTSKSAKSMKRNMQQAASKGTIPLTKSIFKLSNMFKLMLIRMAMRSVISSVREGMQNLAQYSDSTNRAMSALMSAMTQLRNAFSTAFAPLVEYVQPALTQFISLLSQAVTWTAQLFAALAGKDTYVKAVKVQQDYAESLDKTTDSTKDAAKETQKAIAPFDELIQIIRTKKEDSSTDSGKNELKPEDMFTTEEVTNEVKAQAEEIKKIFGALFEPIKKSWDLHGNYAVQASKAAFNILKQLAKDIGASFLQVWKDEGYGERVSSDLIITFGNLAGTVANLGNRFDEAWVKADNGTNIVRHLGDILLTISGFFRQASEDIKGWSAQLDFEPLLVSFDNLLVKMNPVVQSVGKILLWLLENVLLPVSKWAVECAVPAVLDLIAAGFDLLSSVLEALEPLAMWLWEDFLQPFGEWAGETVIAAIQKIVEWITKFSDWIRDHQKEVENMTLAILAFFAAWKVVEFISNVSKMIGGISNLMGVLGNLDLKFGAIVLVLTSIIYIAAQVAKAWDKMTPGEKLATKIIAVAGAIALVVAAVAAFAHDVGTLIIAGSIAAIAGLSILGIASGAGSRNASYGRSANPYSMASEAIRAYPVPYLATGTVVPPRAGEFLAVLGDNKRETEVVSPLSTIEQALENVLSRQRSGQDGNPRTIQVDMYMDRTRFARVVHELNEQEKQRVGVRLVTEGQG